MPRYTTQYLSKLEAVFKEMGYKIRYERGSFKSGSCVIEDKRVIVINKFASLDNKIGFLFEALRTVTIDEQMLSETIRDFYQDLKQTQLIL